MPSSGVNAVQVPLAGVINVQSGVAGVDADHIPVDGAIGVQGLPPIDVPVPLTVNTNDILPVSDALNVPVALVVNAKLDDPDIAPGAPPDNVPDVVKAGEIIPASLPVALSTPVAVKPALVVPDRTPAPRIVADVVNAAIDVPDNAARPISTPAVVNETLVEPINDPAPRIVALVVNVGSVAPDNVPVALNIAVVENVTVDAPAIAPPETGVPKYESCNITAALSFVKAAEPPLTLLYA